MEFFLLQATDVNNAANYLPIALQMIFAIGLIATIIIGSNCLGPNEEPLLINCRILKVVSRLEVMHGSQWRLNIFW